MKKKIYGNNKVLHQLIQMELPTPVAMCHMCHMHQGEP